MSNTREDRWQLRLDNFSRVLSQLEDACRQHTYSNLERAGLVQTFEFSYELGWKTLKDLLFYEGYDLNSPRAVIRQGFESHYLDEDDCETFLDALDKRNRLRHTYTEALALEAEALIKKHYYPMLLRLRQMLERRRTS